MLGTSAAPELVDREKRSSAEQSGQGVGKSQDRIRAINLATLGVT